MLRVATVQARPGMTLALPIYHPRRPDTILLKAGVTLDAHSIGRLRDIELPEMWIRYPSLEFLAEYVSPEILCARGELSLALRAGFEGVVSSAHAKLEYGEYRRAIASLLDKVATSPRAAIYLGEMSADDPLGMRHAASVSYLAMLLGLKLDFHLIRQRARLNPASARDVSNLGLGALLHDVGMLRLDPMVIDRWKQAHNQNDPEWRQHVRVGYDMVRGEVEPSAAVVILHHHQRWDGTGFPRRRAISGEIHDFTGENIHVFARIAFVADVFDRLVRPEGADPVPTVRALRMLRGEPYRNWIDPIVFKGLLAVAPAYPPGSIVRLSDGRMGAVVEWFPEDPCRPTVQIIDEDEGAPVIHTGDRERERIALRRHPDLTITHVGGVDVSRDNFYPSSPGEFDLALHEKGGVSISGDETIAPHEESDDHAAGAA
ncbi:MAG: HD domain-containing protein [Phycisphaerales bacterium]|jgi:HD-GYP domain-containing protein (c-di-GMP phosphodiesterase class II)|nr:HD domain-containing protein [Phycisphaerales bacterium]